MATAPTLYWYQLDSGTLMPTYFGQLDATVAELCSENAVTAPTAKWWNPIACQLVSTWQIQIDTAVRALCTILSVAAPIALVAGANAGQYQSEYAESLDTCVRALCAAPPPYQVDAVHFAASASLTRVAAFSSVSNSGLGIMSFWIKSAINLPAVSPAILSTANIDFTFLDSTNFALLTDSGLPFVEVTYSDGNTNRLANGSWNHLLASWNTNAGAGLKIFHFYQNDTAISVEVNESGAATVTKYETLGEWTFMGSSRVHDMAEFYFAPGQFLDFSVEANRRKFISATGKPVDLGVDGSTPTGTAPAVFFSGDATGFVTNKGTGGAWVASGVITTASTSPSD